MQMQQRGRLQRPSAVLAWVAVVVAFGAVTATGRGQIMPRTRATSASAGITARTASSVKVFVSCLREYDFHPLGRVAPRSCTIAGPSGFQSEVRLRDMKWHAWGAGPATGSGIALSTHPGQIGSTNSSAKVRMFRIAIGCHHRSYYTRARVSLPGWGIPPFTLQLTTQC